MTEDGMREFSKSRFQQRAKRLRFEYRKEIRIGRNADRNQAEAKFDYIAREELVEHRKYSNRAPIPR